MLGDNNRYANKLVCGVGISDKGKYEKYVNHKDTREYAMWQKMIARCYYDKALAKQPTYEFCTVEDYLLSFQNFAEFYNENKWTDELKLIADKDILCHGRDDKIYSRDTILFVDANINLLLTRRQNHRGEYPIGISKYWNKYKSMCNDKGERIYLGLFDTPEDAFYEYKKYKESVIKRVADEYKAKYPTFPDKIYKAMYEYEVFITD